jgi:GT2 family glycosyltransferase
LAVEVGPLAWSRSSARQALASDRLMEHQEPLFSVLIPTFARVEQLKACLHSLSWLVTPPELVEVIVIDDESPIPVEQALLGFPVPFRLRVLRQERAGPAAARNLGAHEATGRYLVFTDDDCLVSPRWLEDYRERWADLPDQGLGGRVENADPNCAYSEAAQWIVDCAQAHFPSSRGSMFFIATNNLAVPRQAFLDLGGFDPTFRTSEDREFSRRWLLSGRILKRLEGATVYHDPRLSLKGFAKKHFGYGRGAFRFHAKPAHGLESHAETTRSALGFYVRVFAGPLKRLLRPGQSFVLFLLCIWQVANLTGFLWEWLMGSREDPSAGP